MGISKKAQQDLEYLRTSFNGIYNSPWSDYITLNWDTVLKIYKEKGLEETFEFIRREDINAYRADEAACGNI